MYALELANQEICVTVMVEDNLRGGVLAQGIYASAAAHETRLRKIVRWSRKPCNAAVTEGGRSESLLTLTSAAHFLFLV